MRWRYAMGLTLLLAPLVAPAARADRLVLENGAVIRTDHWWLDGSRLVYENPAGTVAIPRSAVLRIEPGPVGHGGPITAAPAGDALLAEPPAARQRLQAAREAFAQRDLIAAARLYGAIVREEPDCLEARVGAAAAEMALGQDGVALGLVLDGRVRTPREAALHELLGELRNREERVEDALAEWREAFALEPNDRLREKILKAERELHAGRDYALTLTSHFNLRYDGTVDRVLAREIVARLEELYDELVSTLDHAPPQPITVVLYPTRQFRDVTQSAEWVGGVYDGKIRVPLGGLGRLDRGATAVLAHELTHAIVHSKTRGSCPRWLHEGLAQVNEGRSLTEADERTIRAALSAGDPAAWESRGFSYPVALALTRRLEDRRGPDGLVRLLERLGQGAAPDSALIELYGTDQAGLCHSLAESLGVVERP